MALIGIIIFIMDIIIPLIAFIEVAGWISKIKQLIHVLID